MKKILVLSVLLMVSLFSSAHTLTVRIKGYSPSSGKVYVALFNKENFLQKKLTSKQASTDKESIVVVFENVPTGKYAVSAIQDLNSNGKLDYFDNGVPSEPFGMSCLLGTPYGAPSFDEVSFDVKGNADITITLEDMRPMFQY